MALAAGRPPRVSSFCQRAGPVCPERALEPAEPRPSFLASDAWRPRRSLARPGDTGARRAPFVLSKHFSALQNAARGISLYARINCARSPGPSVHCPTCRHRRRVSVRAAARRRRGRASHPPAAGKLQTSSVRATPFTPSRLRRGPPLQPYSMRSGLVGQAPVAARQLPPGSGALRRPAMAGPELT
jgi:hypothetical protein